MPSDYGMRGQAAMRLMKGGKGKPPEEDELGLPPEEGAPPEEPAMDLASLLGGGAPGPAEAPAEEMPVEPGAEEPPAPPDLDTALAGVEASLEGMPPETAEEIRTHLNAIRELAASGGGAPPMDMPGAEGLPPGPEAAPGVPEEPMA